MISSFVPTCKCGTRGEYTSRKEPTHTMAMKDGWRIKGKSWICGTCYKREHGLEIEADERSRIQSEGLDLLRKTIQSRIQTGTDSGK